MSEAASQPGPVCRKCGQPVPISEDGVAPIYCDDCANRAVSRARRGMYTGSFRDFPVTSALIAINVAMFVAMAFTSDSSIIQTLGDVTYWDALRWGGNNGAYTLGGQYWRLLTACFVHGGLLHLGMNMWCLWSLGRLSERYFGRWSTLAIYVLTGIGGNLLSLAHNPYGFSVGASGAIFGIAGALIAGLKFGNLSIPYGERRSVLTSVISFSLLSFLLGMGYFGFGERIDNMAHLGGFASGLLVGVPLATSVTKSEATNRSIQIATLVITTLLFSAAGLELVKANGEEGKALQALDQKDHSAVVKIKIADAIKILEKQAAAHPNNAELQAELGYVYELNNEPTKAIAAYKKALALNSRLANVEEHLHDLEQTVSTPQPVTK